MATPQIENGYTKIANEILEALSKTNLNGEAWKVLMVIFRKTYGFNKKVDKIALSQFVLATSLKKPAVCRALKRLINMNIIIKIDNDEIGIYRFNKDFDTWKSLTKLLTLTKPLMVVNETVNESLTKRRHTKDNIQKKLLQKKSCEPKDSRIPEVMKLFEEVNPSISKYYGNTTQRSACERLLKKWTLEQIKVVVGILPEINRTPYAKGKSITPFQLEENLGYIKAYIEQKKSANKTINLDEL